MADTSDERYELHQRHRDELTRLDNETFAAMGMTAARIARAIKDQKESEIAMELLMVLQDALSSYRDRYHTLVAHVASDAYLTGRIAGAKSMGQAVGALPEDPPPTMH